MERLPKTVSEPDKTLLTDLFGWLLEPSLYFVRKYCRAPVPTQDINLAQV